MKLSAAIGKTCFNGFIASAGGLLMVTKPQEKNAIEQWETTLGSLAEKKTQVLALLEKTRLDRKSYQLDAMTGSKDSQAKLKQLSSDETDLQTQLLDIQGAQEQAQEQLKAAKKAETAIANREKAKRITTLVKDFHLKSAGIDTALESLAEAFKSFDQSMNALKAETGINTPTYFNGFISPTRVQYVLAYHGLTERLGTRVISKLHYCTFQDLSTRLVGALNGLILDLEGGKK